MEEMVIKGTWGAKADSEKKERERNIFINTVRLLIVLWIIVLIVTIHPKITNKEKTAATSRSALIFKWDSSR